MGDSDSRPLRSYLGLTAAFNLLLGGAIFYAARTDRLPKKLPLSDIALFGVATHKLSRTLTKDKVTAGVRAPFTEYEGEGAPGEDEERPAGTGMRRAVGELVTCPYCVGAWVAGAFVVGYLFAPRATRVVGSVFAALALSDFLQAAYKASVDRA